MTERDSADETAEIPKEILEYLQSSLGTEVRAVAHYDRDSVAIETGDDSDRRFNEEGLEEIIDDLRLQDIGQFNQEYLYEAGSLYCTLRAFENALILHFPQGDNRGTLLSLEPTTAPNITDFISTVLDLLQDYSDQEISHGPEWRHA